MDRTSDDVERIAAYNPDKVYPAPQNQPPAQQPMAQPPAPMNYNMPPIVNTRGPMRYNPKGRAFGIMFSVLALVVTIVSLFAIPIDFESFDTTLLRVGMMEGQTTILILTFVTLAIGVIALLEPILTFASGVCLMVTAYLVFSDATLMLTTPGLIVFILLAIDVIALGFVATVFMRKFVNNNVRGVNFIKACYLAWTGIPHM